MDSSTPDAPVESRLHPEKANEVLGIGAYFKIEVVDNTGELHAFVLNQDAAVDLAQDLMGTDGIKQFIQEVGQE